MIVSFKINRAKVLLTAGLCVAAAAAFLYFRYETKSAETMAQAENARVIPMVTAELKAKGPDGKDVEVYRWSPDTIPVKKEKPSPCPSGALMGTTTTLSSKAWASRARSKRKGNDRLLHRRERRHLQNRVPQPLRCEP
ncbi:hypothetical protein N6H14_16220 [Paenibacillus sp. CC-CFT747]|nr:hypothetical protein N6H14_16220 [Paenibacillus sp. CC-CFT747]